MGMTGEEDRSRGVCTVVWNDLMKGHFYIGIGWFGVGKARGIIQRGNRQGTRGCGICMGIGSHGGLEFGWSAQFSFSLVSALLSATTAPSISHLLHISLQIPSIYIRWYCGPMRNPALAHGSWLVSGLARQRRRRAHKHTHTLSLSTPSREFYFDSCPEERKENYALAATAACASSPASASLSAALAGSG